MQPLVKPLAQVVRQTSPAFNGMLLQRHAERPKAPTAGALANKSTPRAIRRLSARRDFEQATGFFVAARENDACGDAPDFGVDYTDADSGWF